MNYMHKLCNGIGPEYLLANVKKKNESRVRNLRNDNEFYVESSKKNLLKESFMLKGLNMYNSLLKSYSSVRNVTFKTFLAKYVKDNFEIP